MALVGACAFVVGWEARARVRDETAAKWRAVWAADPEKPGFSCTLDHGGLACPGLDPPTPLFDARQKRG